MILSAQNIFSDQQAITATADSENVIDTGVRGTPYGANSPLLGDLGPGNKIPLLIQVTEDFNNLTSLEVKVSTGDTESLGTEIISQTILAADLKAGKQIAIDVMPNGVIERYLGMEYVVVGGAPTTGKVTAGISMGNQTNTGSI